MSAPIPHTCPDIDKVIKMVKSIQRVAQEGMRSSERHSDDHQRYKDIEWDIDDIVGRLEDLRKDNQTLREYGEGMEAERNELQKQIDELENSTPCAD